MRKVFQCCALVFILPVVALLGGPGINTPAQAAGKNPSVECVSCHAAEKDSVAHSKHASAKCLDCHTVQTTGKAPFESHPNIVTKPGEVDNLAKTCGKCHADHAKTYPTSLHATTQGLKHGAIAMLGEKQGKFVGDNRCYTCHATCNGCHLPQDATGKVTNKHDLQAKVPTQNCKTCHDQTGTGYVGYQGEFEPSVHAKAGMTCADCHGGTQVHGTGKVEQTMADVPQPECTNCHAQKKNDKGAVQNVAHNIHQEKVDCSACHVGWYYNCYNCHGYDAKGEAMGYDKFNTNRYLARRKDNGKIGAVVHIPMSTEVGGEKYAKGAWVFKDRHSTVKEALQCQDCHLNAQAFVMDDYRQAPFLGKVDGEFVPKQEVMGKILIFRSHTQIMGQAPKPGQTPDAECLKCHS